MLHRAFTDPACVPWMARNLESADVEAANDRRLIRPPGLWFTSPGRQEKRFLSWPTLFEGELEPMPEARLQQLLERADTRREWQDPDDALGAAMRRNRQPSKPDPE